MCEPTRNASSPRTCPKRIELATARCQALERGGSSLSGTGPDLITGIHGDDPRQVYSDLCDAVDVTKSLHQHLAWTLVESPNADIRDGQRALKHATQARELSKWKGPYALTTLATAYAETGDFANAVKWQNIAIQLATKSDQAEFSRRMLLFKSGKPLR